MEIRNLSDIDIRDSLDDLGYTGKLTAESDLKKAIEIGPKSIEFTELIAWLAKEIQTLLELESRVNAVTDSDDSSSFLLEVSSFLKELSCPYQSLMEGPISQRFVDEKSRIILLDYLCSELHSARMSHGLDLGKENSLSVEMDASSTALGLTSLIESLDLKTDVTENNPVALLLEAEEKIKEILSSHPNILFKKALDESLSEEHWSSLSELCDDFLAEYRIRREMLLTRLDVTIQSFKWGEGSQGKENKIAAVFVPRRQQLRMEPCVDVSDVLVAPEDIFIIEKTSSAELVKNTKSSVNRVLIPHVPDRGGRPKEQRPPVEMPGWAKRNPGGGRGDFHGSRGGQRGKKFRGGQHSGRKKSFDALGSY